MRRLLAVVAVALMGTAGRAEDGIRVSGTGVVTIKPDCAHVTGGVSVDAKTAGDTIKKAADLMAAVTKALEGQKVAKEDIKTVEFDLQPRYVRANKGGTEEEYTLAGYRCVNLVVVTVRNPDDAGKIIDAMAAGGANQFRQISFSADQKSAEKEALASAMADAKAKADTIAGASGVTVGDVVSVTEQSRGGGYADYAPATRGLSESATTIAPGSKRVTASVTVLYKVGPKKLGLGAGGPNPPPDKK